MKTKKMHPWRRAYDAKNQRPKPMAPISLDLNDSVRVKLDAQWVETRVAFMSPSRQVAGLEPLEHGPLWEKHIGRGSMLMLSCAAGPWREIAKHKRGRIFDLKKFEAPGLAPWERRMKAEHEFSD